MGHLYHGYVTNNQRVCQKKTGNLIFSKDYHSWMTDDHPEMGISVGEIGRSLRHEDMKEIKARISNRSNQGVSKNGTWAGLNS